MKKRSPLNCPHPKLTSPTSETRHQQLLSSKGYTEVTTMLVTDVGDKMYVLTSIRCWGRFCLFKASLKSPRSTISLHSLHLRQAPTFKSCHQHRNSVTNFHKSSPTSRCHQYHCHPTSSIATLSALPLLFEDRQSMILDRKYLPDHTKNTDSDHTGIE